jgi:hypothetical protein
VITINELITYLKKDVPNWQTGIQYNAGQNYIQYGGIIYICIVSHTSTAFTADLASNKWRVSQLYNSLQNGVAYIQNYCNRKIVLDNYTEQFIYIENTNRIATKEYPVTAVSDIQLLDEDTGVFDTIFEHPDNAANSTVLGNYVTLLKGYSIEAGKTYKIIYTGGLSIIPNDLKQVAVEQAVIDFYNSSESLGWFGLTQKDFGGQATKAFALQDRSLINERHNSILNHYRNFNI